MPVIKKDDNPNQPPRPPIKWAGGKGQLLAQLTPLFPQNIKSLIEPFAGGAAVFFRLQPLSAILIDKNEELINFYRVVRDKLAPLLTDLKKHAITKEYYYHTRSLNPLELTGVERASRFLFLNKTCFNGLWRTNRRGHMNVPYGRYKNPRIIDAPNLHAVSHALQFTDIHYDDFALAAELSTTSDFIYLDPPYAPISATSSFTTYTGRPFGENEQRRLAQIFHTLDKKGCRVMLSNSDTPLIRHLYQTYNINTVQAKRHINSKAEKRGPVQELVIRQLLTKQTLTYTDNGDIQGLINQFTK